MKKRYITLLIIAVMAVIMLSPAASAADITEDLPYSAYSYNNSDKPVALPAPYTVTKTLIGEDMETAPFTDLNDIFYDGADTVYICDSGNNRIVITDTDFKIKKILSDFENGGNRDGFSTPGGIYANENLIYIADTGNSRISVFDKKTFKLNRVIEKPEILLLGDDYTFSPTDITVDNAGRIYVIATGINQGLICLDENGKFSTFSGAPQVTPNMAERLWRKFATKKQLEQMQQYVPTEYSAALIDKNGFIYAVSQSSVDTPVAKLNSEGKNVLVKPSADFKYGDLAYDSKETPGFTDIALDENQSYFLLDSKHGKIYTYARDGYLMYAFGGSGSQKGLFLSAGAIEIINGKIAVADRIKGSITLFECTQFGKSVNLALKQFDDGEYEEAGKTWKNISEMASGYILAQVGIAKTDIQHRDYRAAMKRLKPINERELYADVFERMRDEFIKNNFYKLIAAAVVSAAAAVVINRLLKKSEAYNRIKQSDTLRYLRYTRYLIFHPFDGFWDIKREKKGNARTALIILALFILCYGIRAQFSGYVVTGIISSEINALYSIAMIIIPLGFWVVSNWCFTALMDGEGNMKDIFTASCYALTPYVLFSVPMFIFSHILTSSEAAFYNVADTVCLIWVLLLLFFGMMTTHSYSLSKSLLTAVLTLVGICLMIFILLLITNVMQQVIVYFYNIYKELLFRTY